MAGSSSSARWLPGPIIEELEFDNIVIYFVSFICMACSRGRYLGPILLRGRAGTTRTRPALPSLSPGRHPTFGEYVSPLSLGVLWLCWPLDPAPSPDRRGAGCGVRGAGCMLDISGFDAMLATGTILQTRLLCTIPSVRYMFFLLNDSLCK